MIKEGLILGVLLLSTLNARAQVFGVPVSDFVIEGELALPGTDIVQFSAREGTMLTIHDDAGHGYGLLPLLGSDRTLRSATLALFELSNSEGGEERASQMKNSRGKPVMLKAVTDSPLKLEIDNFSADVTIRRISRWRFPLLSLINPKGHSPAELQNYFSSGICCVSCGEMTVCGGGVSMGCGSCSGGGGRLPV